MTIIYGNEVPSFTQDLMSTDELKIGVRVDRRDQAKTLVPKHVVDTYYLSKNRAGRNGEPARVPVGDGNVLLAARNTDVALYVGMYSKNNVGFGVSVETGGDKVKPGKVFVTELHFPAEKRDGWVYGYIDRGDDGSTMRVKSKSALGDAAQSLWKIRITIWPILKWEGHNEMHEVNEPPKSVPRSGNTGTGGLTTGQTVGNRDTARHTRIVESDQSKRASQTFFIMTGADEEVAKPIRQAP